MFLKILICLLERNRFEKNFDLELFEKVQIELFQLFNTFLDFIHLSVLFEIQDQYKIVLKVTMSHYLEIHGQLNYGAAMVTHRGLPLRRLSKKLKRVCLLLYYLRVLDRVILYKSGNNFRIIHIYRLALSFQNF